MFARELTLLFDASACLISSYDRDTQQVTDWAAHVVPPATLNVVAEDYSLADFPVTMRVLDRAGRAATTVGDGGDPAEHELLEQMGFKALLMTPLVMGGKAVGLVELFDTHPRTFSRDDIQFCRLLCDHAGIVLGTATPGRAARGAAPGHGRRAGRRARGEGRLHRQPRPDDRRVRGRGGRGAGAAAAASCGRPGWARCCTTSARSGSPSRS